MRYFHLHITEYNLKFCHKNMNLQAKWHVLSTHLMRDKGLSDVLGNKLPFRIWDHSFFDILVFKGVKNPHIFWTKYVQTYKKILLAKAKPPPFSLSKVIFLSSLLKSTQPFESWNFCKYPCLIDGNWTSSKAFLVTICKIVAIWLFKYIKTYHHSRLFWKCPIIQIRSFGVEWLPKILLQLKRLHANFMHIFWIHDDKLCIFPLHSSWNFSILHLFKSLFCWFSTTLFFLP